jgi:hypothetical protein
MGLKVEVLLGSSFEHFACVGYLLIEFRDQQVANRHMGAPAAVAVKTLQIMNSAVRLPSRWRFSGEELCIRQKSVGAVPIIRQKTLSSRVRGNGRRSGRRRSADVGQWRTPTQANRGLERATLFVPHIRQKMADVGHPGGNYTRGTRFSVTGED